MKRRNLSPPAPTRTTILYTISNLLDGIESWRDFGDGLAHMRHADSCYRQACALIELLEINDCGSSGGYDEGQTKRGIKDRYKWLCRRYGDK